MYLVYIFYLMAVGGGETSKPESTMDRLAVNLNDHEQSTKDYVVSSIDGSLPSATEGKIIM
ncbi:hypothetical protein HanHA300_Chr01g0002201 [Helianthus annuus]|nr:hypothetical protein HanHA300_Chr01g0002201 [Helianthus annuus]KAJ0781906.1 hypothetical protein HanLR1_Chr01g0002121 [Helianthus annuus]